MGTAMSPAAVTPVTDELLKEIVQRIVAAFDVEAIILFGSHAYGEAREDSDVDLLIVTEALSDLSVFQRHRAISELFSDRLFALDVIVRTREELAQLCRQDPAFFGEIGMRGKVLYEQGRGTLGREGRGGLPDCAYPDAPAPASPA